MRHWHPFLTVHLLYINIGTYCRIRTYVYRYVLREYSGSFEDVSSNTVICFRGIPKEFQGKMTVLPDISDKDTLYSHCYQVNDCQEYFFQPLSTLKYQSFYLLTNRGTYLIYWKPIHTSKWRYVLVNTYLFLEVRIDF